MEETTTPEIAGEKTARGVFERFKAIRKMYPGFCDQINLFEIEGRIQADVGVDYIRLDWDLGQIVIGYIEQSAIGLAQGLGFCWHQSAQDENWWHLTNHDEGKSYVAAEAETALDALFQVLSRQED